MIQASQESVKKDYESYVDKATILIHSPETSQSVINLLNGQNHVQQVAMATVMIMQRLDTAARAAGVEVQDSVKVFGAHEIVALVAELGTAAGKFAKMSDKLTELALSVCVQDYVKAEAKAGRIDPQKLKTAIDADIRKLPPAKRKEIQQSQIRIQQTARQYNNGKGKA